MPQLRVCLESGTAYAAALKACPQCGAPTRDALYSPASDVAQAAEYYLAEGEERPAGLPASMRLGGPGAPKRQAARAKR